MSILIGAVVGVLVGAGSSGLVHAGQKPGECHGGPWLTCSTTRWFAAILGLSGVVIGWATH